MKRKLVLATLALAALIPRGALAKIDPASCAGASATSVISGLVQNVRGDALRGITVEIQRSGTGTSPLHPPVTTDVDGRYVICASGPNNAAGHDTYDVRASDKVNGQRAASLYAAASQPYTTYTNVGDADFTNRTGLALVYSTALTITPNEISTKPGIRTVTGQVPVTFLVRSKGPAGLRMLISLGHRAGDGEIEMTYAGTQNGTPEAGGWNEWIHTETFAPNRQDALYWAGVRGVQTIDGTPTTVTQVDRQPYVLDRSPPAFGYQGVEFCGNGVVANKFAPASPEGTTNPQPIVRHGVCDYNGTKVSSEDLGASSGLDPFTLRGWLCPDSGVDITTCDEIEPVLDTFTITWWPSEPLALGRYWLVWEIKDGAGNVARNDPGHELIITDRGGQTPRFVEVKPANLGNGSNFGVVIGMSQATPTSYPTIGFRVLDADGQGDIVIGSVKMRVYYPDERSLVYEYDPNAPTYDPITKRGPGKFDLSCGCFTAIGFPLQGKPSGRYLAQAQVNDYGGNHATASWHWLFIAAS